MRSRIRRQAGALKMICIDSSVFKGAFLPADPNTRVCSEFFENMIFI